MSDPASGRELVGAPTEWRTGQVGSDLPEERRSVREEHRLLTRRRIIDSALEVFASKGYAATTIEDVVARAGVARGTFYLHFKNKLAIVQAITADEFQPVAALYEDLDRLVTSGNRNRENMREWMTRAIDWFETHRTMATVWQELPSSEPEFELPSFLIAGQMRRYLAQWPESEQGAARLRIILLVQQLGRAFLLSSVRHALGVDNEFLIDVLTDLWLDALKPPQGQGRGKRALPPA
jgi:AcrR family transcriptional regulator